MSASDLVPIKFAQLVLRIVEAQGFDVEDFLASSGFAYNPLQIQPDMPSHITAQEYNRLYTKITWLLQDECFGLHLKAKVPTGTFRMMCLCLIHCKNLGAAIERVEEFSQFCRNLAGLDPLPHTPLSFEKDTVFNHLPNVDDYQSSNTEQLVAVAASMHMWRRFCSWLIGKPLDIIDAHFKAEKPDQRLHLLEEVFRCPLKFGQKTNGFRFAASYLNAPIIHNEDSLNEFLKSAPYHLSINHIDETSIQTRIRAIVGNDFSQDFPSVENIAEKLNISVRTLRRRLQQEGTHYQAFKDKIRKEAALTYLNRPTLKINTVAALMGFDETSAFHRAFKKWTGMTPGEYRQSVGSK